MLRFIDWRWTNQQQNSTSSRNCFTKWYQVSSSSMVMYGLTLFLSFEDTHSSLWPLYDCIIPELLFLQVVQIFCISVGLVYLFLVFLHLAFCCWCPCMDINVLVQFSLWPNNVNLPCVPFILSIEMSRLTRDGTAEPISRDQILRHAGDRGIFIFPVQVTTSRIGDLNRLIHTLLLYVMTIHTYIHTGTNIHSINLYQILDRNKLIASIFMISFLSFWLFELTTKFTGSKQIMFLIPACFSSSGLSRWCGMLTFLCTSLQCLSSIFFWHVLGVIVILFFVLFCFHALIVAL